MVGDPVVRLAYAAGETHRGTGLDSSRAETSCTTVGDVDFDCLDNRRLAYRGNHELGDAVALLHFKIGLA